MTMRKLAYSIRVGFVKRSNATKLQKALMGSGLMGTAALGAKNWSLADRLDDAGKMVNTLGAKNKNLSNNLESYREAHRLGVKGMEDLNNTVAKFQAENAGLLADKVKSQEGYKALQRAGDELAAQLSAAKKQQEILQAENAGLLADKVKSQEGYKALQRAGDEMAAQLSTSQNQYNTMKEMYSDPHVQAFLGTKQHAGELYDDFISGLSSFGRGTRNVFRPLGDKIQSRPDIAGGSLTGINNFLRSLPQKADEYLNPQ